LQLCDLLENIQINASRVAGIKKASEFSNSREIAKHEEKTSLVTSLHLFFVLNTEVVQRVWVKRHG
jgi:hypothetical protein